MLSLGATLTRSSSSSHTTLRADRLASDRGVVVPVATEYLLPPPPRDSPLLLLPLPLFPSRPLSLSLSLSLSRSLSPPRTSASTTSRSLYLGSRVPPRRRDVDAAWLRYSYSSSNRGGAAAAAAQSPSRPSMDPSARRGSWARVGVTAGAEDDDDDDDERDDATTDTADDAASNSNSQGSLTSVD